METKSHKFVFFTDESVTVTLQEWDGKCFIHVDVNKFSHSHLKRFYRLFADIQTYLTQQGLCEMYSYSPNLKFCQMFGGKVLSTFTHNNNTYGVIRWEWTR